jgi:RNA recognition motif-containing protein
LKLLVTKLPVKITEKDLLKMFQKIGKVIAHNIVMDKDTGRSKGFGFVEMPNDQEAGAAIKTLNGKLIGGRIIRVKTADNTEGDAPDLVVGPRRARYVPKDAGDAGRVKDGSPSRGARRPGPARKERH